MNHFCGLVFRMLQNNTYEIIQFEIYTDTIRGLCLLHLSIDTIIIKYCNIKYYFFVKRITLIIIGCYLRKVTKRCCDI